MKLPCFVLSPNWRTGLHWPIAEHHQMPKCSGLPWWLLSQSSPSYIYWAKVRCLNVVGLLYGNHYRPTQLGQLRPKVQLCHPLLDHGLPDHPKCCHLGEVYWPLCATILRWQAVRETPLLMEVRMERINWPIAQVSQNNYFEQLISIYLDLFGTKGYFFVKHSQKQVSTTPPMIFFF